MIYIIYAYFNPRPREEGDTNSADLTQCQNDFNPRPREEGDKAAFVIVIFHPHFNPRPREEGDVQMRSERVRLDISIHALVKRATALS